MQSWMSTASRDLYSLVLDYRNIAGLSIKGGINEWGSYYTKKLYSDKATSYSRIAIDLIFDYSNTVHNIPCNDLS